MLHSVTNKGTTTEEQVGFGDNEADCKNPELDLMQYYDKFAHSCFPPRSYYAKRKLANEDAVALITAAEQGQVPQQCKDETEPPMEDFCGNLCFTDGSCGGMCGNCHWFTCKL